MLCDRITPGQLTRDRTGPLTILHVLVPGPVGGLESVVATLARLQHDAGHRVTVCAILTHEGSSAFVDELEPRGVSVVTCRIEGRAYLRERRFVRRLCEQLRPDVVHTHGYRADVMHVGAGRARGIPSVTTVHGFTGGGLKNRVYERLQRLMLRRFAAVVAVSRQLGDELLAAGVDRRRLYTIVNAYDAAREPLGRDAARGTLGIDRRGPWLGWIGRLSHEKGADVLLDALALLPATLRVCIVGAGPERDRLEQQAKALGVGTRVQWAGPVPRAGSLVRAFDAVVLSSRTEGTPVVLFEAMAAEVPVVATSVGGVPDVVTAGEAWLVPPESPERLAAAIRDVVQNPAESRRRAAAARDRLQRVYGGAAWARRYIELYRQLDGWSS